MDVAEIAQTIADAYVPAGGRRSEIGDSAVVQVLLSELQAGVRLEPACMMAGIELQTLKRWQRRAAAGEEPFALLDRCIKRAQAGVEGELSRNIIAAAKQPAYWAAAATYLERTAPERWARPTDRQDRAQAAIEVYVRGISSNDVKVGVSISPSVSLPSTTATYIEQSNEEHLIESQQHAAEGTQDSTQHAAFTPRALIQNGGAALRGGPHAPGGGASMPAPQTVEKSARPGQEQEKGFVLSTATSTETEKTPRPKNPAAVERRRLLRARAARERRRKHKQKRVADALRWAEQRTTKQKKAREAAAAEAALPAEIG